MKKQPPKRFYRRNLPHFQPANSVFFVTYNLNGSLPKEAIKLLKAKRDFRISKLENKGLSELEIKKEISNTREWYFGKFDALLDNPSSGPTHLRNADVAKEVIESIQWLHNHHHYKLICFTIMWNHVHKIIYKVKKPLWQVMKSHKGFTGNLCNKLIGSEGQFWQSESFDHIIRTREKLKEKVHYTLLNPKTAKLVKDWRDFPFSYLNPEFEHFAP